MPGVIDAGDRDGIDDAGSDAGAGGADAAASGAGAADGNHSGTDDRPAAPARRRWSVRWLAGGGAAVLAAVLGLVLVLRYGETAVCAAELAAPPSGATVYKGKASHYDAGRSGGSCSFPGPPANKLYVALGSAQYAGSAACGTYLDVTGPKGTVRVMVLDRCAGCTGNKIDLSRQAFARIADPAKGIVSVRYRAVVDPPLSGPLTFRVKRGASQWWFAVQIGNHGNPVRSVAVRRAGSGWRAAKRQPDNYWVVDGGLGPGPYSIRVTDVYGHQAVAHEIRLAPRQVQRSSVRLYDEAAPSPSAPAASASASAAPSPGASNPPTGAAPTPDGPVAAVLDGRPAPADCG